jgi:hypothetical protein
MQKKSFPDLVSPMMAQSAKEPFDSPDWIFEIKLDGYRAITVFDADGKPRLCAGRARLLTPGSAFLFWRLYCDQNLSPATGLRARSRRSRLFGQWWPQIS